jgi:hypothetical protein
MAKTSIQLIQNSRSTPIDYQNLENNGCNRTVPPGQARTVGCAVPWVNNETDFRVKRLGIQDSSSGQVLFQIWQRTVGGADLVRVSTAGWSDPGDAIPGNATAGGRERILIVRDDGVSLEDLS